MCSSWSAGMPGPLSVTEISSRPPSTARAVTLIRSPGSVWATALRTRLRSTCVSRSGSALSVPLTASSSKSRSPNSGRSRRRSSKKSSSVDRRGSTQPARLGAGQREHVADQAVELVEAAQQRHGALVPARLVGLTVEQLDLGAQHGERRAQLVRGVGDEVALAPERPLEAIEHVVERVRTARRTSPRPRTGPRRGPTGRPSRPRPRPGPSAAAARRSASRARSRRRPRARARAGRRRRRCAAGSPGPGRPAVSGSARRSVPTRRPWATIGWLSTRSRPASRRRGRQSERGVDQPAASGECVARAPRGRSPRGGW